MSQPPLIDHNPHEKRVNNRIWWVILLGVIFSGSVYFWTRDPDWWALALGGFAGMMLATWAIEITGNKPVGLRKD